MTRQEFETAIEFCRPTMVNFAYNRLHSWAEAEDAVSRMMVYLAKAYPGIVPKEAKAVTLFINLLVHYIGRQARDTQQRERLLSEAMRDKRETYIDPQHLATLRLDVQRAMATLPPLIQYAAWRVHVEGYAWDFVAEELGIKTTNPGNTLKQVVWRKLKSLQPLLTAYAPQWRRK